VCVSKAKGDYGCVDASPDDLTEEVRVMEATFQCPQCYRASKRPIPVSHTSVLRFNIIVHQVVLVRHMWICSKTRIHSLELSSPSGCLPVLEWLWV